MPTNTVLVDMQYLMDMRCYEVGVFRFPSGSETIDKSLSGKTRQARTIPSRSSSSEIRLRLMTLVR